MRLTSLATGALIALASIALSQEPQVAIRPISPSDQRDALAAWADSKIRSGSFDEAVVFYRQALQVDIHETPNFELTIRLAEAQCLAGELAAGARTLRDFLCMLDVSVAITPCYTGEEPDPKLGYRLVRNGSLTDDCFATMCSEIFLAYWEEPSQAYLARVPALRRKARGVAIMCEAPDQ